MADKLREIAARALLALAFRIGPEWLLEGFVRQVQGADDDQLWQG
ncbi:hypothetical protein [Pseudovibrio sp. POLY-S9]|nr:hypothetical protein [Pseudovibrio sp. POLY-S9]